MSAHRQLLWFQEITPEDESLVGKAAMIMSRVQDLMIGTPQGFVITADAFHDFLISTTLDRQIEGLLAARLSDDHEELETVGNKIKALILNTEIPHELSHEIMLAYLSLCDSTLQDAVAIKTSVTSAFTSDRPHLDSIQPYLNVIGEANVAVTIRQCWADFFDAQWLMKRVATQKDHRRWGLAVMVEQMIKPVVSGVLLTADLTHQDKQSVIIEALRGDHSLVDYESVLPDRYKVTKHTWEITRSVYVQEQQIVRHEESLEPVWERVPKELQNLPKLRDEEIFYLAEMATKLEHHMIQPLEIDWAKQGNTLYFIGVRPFHPRMPAQPLKPHGTMMPKGKTSTAPLDLPIVAQGEGVSNGIFSGYARLVTNQIDIERVQHSEIAVLEQTNSVHIEMLKRCAGVIVETGGLTSHAAMVTQELGIPCVVGVKDALKIFKTGKVYTIDGRTGFIYAGGAKKRLTQHTVDFEVEESKEEEEKTMLPEVVTATRIYIHIDSHEDVTSEMLAHTDGVLFDPRRFLHKMPAHPLYLIEQQLNAQFYELLHEELDILCEELQPEPVIYQLSDWTHEEYSNLRYGLQYESIRDNKHHQGTKLHLEKRELLDLELEAVKYVRNKSGRRNIWLMLTHVSTPADLVELKRHMATLGMSRSGQLKFFLRVEFPYQLIAFEKFAVNQVDGVVFDIGRLWQNFIGHKSGISIPSANELEFWNMLAKTVQIAKRNHVETIAHSLQASDEETMKTLISAGIQGISTGAQRLSETTQHIAEAENFLVEKKMMPTHQGEHHHRYKHPFTLS